MVDAGAGALAALSSAGCSLDFLDRQAAAISLPSLRVLASVQEQAALAEQADLSRPLHTIFLQRAGTCLPALLVLAGAQVQL